MWLYQVEPNHVGLKLLNLLVSIYRQRWTNSGLKQGLNVLSVEVMCLEAVLHVSNCMDTPPLKPLPLFLSPPLILPLSFSPFHCCWFQ